MGKRQKNGWQHTSDAFPTRFMFCPSCKRNRRFQQAARYQHECLSCGLLMDLEKKPQPRLVCCVCGGTAHFKLHNRAACIDHKSALQLPPAELSEVVARYEEAAHA